MKLGSLHVQWVTYVPTWKGNREIPKRRQKEEQMSLEIRRLRPVDELSDISNAELREWWKDRALKWWNHKDIGAQVQKAGLPALQMVYRLDRDTKNWLNFEFQDEHGNWAKLDDIVEIVFFLPRPTGTDQSESIFHEITEAMSRIAHATEEELGNFVSEYGGSRAAVRASSAKKGASPRSAATAPDQTAEDGSPT